MTACKSGDGSRVKHLLGTGLAGPNDMTLANDTPLSMAIKGGFKEVVQLLLNQGADPNITCGRFETSPLQIAVTYEKPDIARLLITSGADIEYTSSRGWSILHHLFERDRSMLNTEYFSMFIGQTSFDDTKDLEGWTALHRCAAFGTAEDVDFLHRMGALRLPDRYRTNSGRNPIHVAALMNNVSTLKALMQCRASLPTTGDRSVSNQYAMHFVDAYGFTPLHHAVYGHAKETVVYLLQHGADPRAPVRRTSSWFPENHEGDVVTVKDLARMSGGGEFLGTLVQVLQEANYNVTTDGEDMIWG
ncbi:hypothetical protein N3K66_005310 [Trichothecium roseum]|uniref:Uncharacterized protein n=1 Tax=Trichothecium roseum TaxID=47278 RepID=A0ACC0UYT3_9HYPO|nr:hypothetical protein N3K66_005310 [Trichothecium roseum]